MDNLSPPEGHFSILNKGIAQIAIVVKDLDKTVKEYWNVFGVGPWHFYTYKRPLLGMSRYHGKEVDNALRIALSYFGPTRIELIEVKAGPSLQEDFINDHGYGVQHLGILVDNMEFALNEAREKGFEIIQEGSGFGPDGDGHYAYLNTEDIFGITYELIERPKRRHTPEKIFPESLNKPRRSASTSIETRNKIGIDKKPHIYTERKYFGKVINNILFFGFDDYFMFQIISQMPVTQYLFLNIVFVFPVRYLNLASFRVLIKR